MKTFLFLLLLFLVFPSFLGFGQRYEVWLKTHDTPTFQKWRYQSSNDSILVVHSFSPFSNKEIYYSWNEIYELKIRNKGRHVLGKVVGACIGFGIFAATSNPPQNKMTSDATINTCIGFFAGGMLIGHLITGQKIVVPILGKTAREKNELLLLSLKK